MTKLQPLVSSECNWLRESACTCLSLLLPLFAWLVNAHFLLAPPQHTHQCLLADPPPLLCSWCPAWRMTSLKRASLCAKSWRSSFSSTSLASKVGERKEKPLASRVLCVSMLRPGSHWFAQRISLSRSKSKRWTVTCKGQPDSCFFPFSVSVFPAVLAPPVLSSSPHTHTSVLTPAGSFEGYDAFHKLYPELLKRMDDSSNEIRSAALCLCRCVSVFNSQCNAPWD